MAILIILLDNHNVANMMQCSYHKAFAGCGEETGHLQEKAITQGSSWTSSTLIGTRTRGKHLRAYGALQRILNKITSPPTLHFVLLLRGQ